MNFWLRLTSFGDVIVTLPAAAAIVMWLLAGRAWRMALWWIVLFSTAMALVVATKIAFIGWGVGSPSLDFTGISGHAMRASAVMPVIGYLVFHSRRQGWQMAGVLGGLAVGGMIAVSRFMVHAHSISEAFTGALLGTAVGLIFIHIARPTLKPAVNAWLILATLLGLYWMSSGEPAPTQAMLTDVALKLSGHVRPFTRADWHSNGPGVLVTLRRAQ